MVSFLLHGWKVDVLPSAHEDSPVVYLNSYSDDMAGAIQKELSALGSQDVSLVTISGLSWNRDMTPWPMKAPFHQAEPFSGGADGYLRVLLEEILPRAEKLLQGTPRWRGLAGYSLAGLFALYALFRTDAFSRIACMSGSLWYEGFDNFVRTHEMKRKTDCIYLSLGDKESATRNPVLRMVGQKTGELQQIFFNTGIDTAFVLNEGGHFRDADRRTALGIHWILEWKADQSRKGTRIS